MKNWRWIDDRSVRTGEPSAEDDSADRKDRRFYFRELFRLQAELIKLQDWCHRRGRRW